MLVMNNCNYEFSFVIIVHYVETEQIELKVKSASNWSKGYEVVTLYLLVEWKIEH